MTSPADTAEPPMEEILASIRRIITEEPGSPAGDGAPRGEASAEAPMVGAAELPADEASGPPTLTPGEAAALEAEPPAASVETDALVSREAGATVASSFDRLASARAESGRTRAGLAMPEPGRSLEDVTRDLLAPLLKAWLDENLPAIVEARVDEEVTRIARGRIR